MGVAAQKLSLHRRIRRVRKARVGFLVAWLRGTLLTLVSHREPHSEPIVGNSEVIHLFAKSPNQTNGVGYHAWASSKVQTDPVPNNPEIGQQNLQQIMIDGVVEGCDVQNAVDDGGTREYSSGV